MQLCTLEGAYNGFELGLAAVLEFLAETCSRLPQGAPPPEVELLQILKNRPTLERLRAWAGRYYD